MKIMIYIFTLLLTSSCATYDPQKAYKPKAKTVKPISFRELRQQKILKCTLEFIRQGVDFEVAVKGCKDDIYFK